MPQVVRLLNFTQALKLKALRPAPATGAPWDFAAAVAREVGLPEPVGVIDVARVNGRLRLCELTPFSGADLYGCDPFAIVDAISALLA